MKCICIYTTVAEKRRWDPFSSSRSPLMWAGAPVAKTNELVVTSKNRITFLSILLKSVWWKHSAHRKDRSCRGITRNWGLILKNFLSNRLFRLGQYHCDAALENHRSRRTAQCTGQKIKVMNSEPCCIHGTRLRQSDYFIDFASIYYSALFKLNLDIWSLIILDGNKRRTSSSIESLLSIACATMCNIHIEYLA